jgi:hypothetical protein
MKIITYWETVEGNKIPPYVLIGILTMRLAFGDKFLLLTPKNVNDFIDVDVNSKKWIFEKYNSNLTSAIASVVAKSDFIRMRYIYLNGGLWIDSDTLVMSDLPDIINFKADILHYHSEQFFGANANNTILKIASANMWQDEFQVWGNPGKIKNLIKSYPIETILYKYFDPGYRPLYAYATNAIIRDKNISVDDFITNPDLKILKLYNTDLSVSELAKNGLIDFFKQGSLLSRIILTINPNVDYWVNESLLLENTLMA